MRTKAAIIESIILGIGVLLSIQGTAKAVGYSDSYIPYFSLAALGIVFIVILILLRKKKLNFLLGIGFIIVYLYVAGFGYIVCVQNAARMRRLGYYEGKAIEITIKMLPLPLTASLEASALYTPSQAKMTRSTTIFIPVQRAIIW